MSDSAQSSGRFPLWIKRLRDHLPTIPEALARLLVLVVAVLFLNTFLLQPYLIPSESMERTLLVGDFVLVNKQVYAPVGSLSRWFLPYREVARGDIVIFHHPQPPYLIKRVVGLPGDRMRIIDGRVSVNGSLLDEPYAAFEPVAFNPFLDEFPARVYTDPNVEPLWWKQMQSLSRSGDLVVPQGKYFVLGDNRNHSKDSRFWGFVGRDQIVARPILIYFSLSRPSTTDVEDPSLQPSTQAAPVTSPATSDDRLGHEGQLSARLSAFARWKRIFHVVR